MNIKVIPTGPFGANCVIVQDGTGGAVVVDPGADAALIDSAVMAEGLAVSAYWLTHGHLDHISALFDMLVKHPAPVFMHPSDSSWAFTELNTIDMYPPPLLNPPEPLKPVAAETVLESGTVSARVIHTPGHTPGCVCYYFEKEGVLLSGDTLFRGSAGRTDLPGGDWSALAASLKTLAGLPPETRVIPGHGRETDIGCELRLNPFMQGDEI